MTRRIWTVLLAMAALAACGDDDNEAPPVDDLTGTWSITRFEYVSQADPDVRVELIEQGGAGTVTLAANGTYTATITFPGEAPAQATGTWSYTADTFTLRDAENAFDWVFALEVGTDTLILTGADAEFDFDDDEIDDPADWNLTLVRD
jgi:hypothetical protein